MLADLLSRAARLAQIHQLSPQAARSYVELIKRAHSARSTRSTDRFHDLGLVGTGGMGEVRRVLDCDLNRTMAMKVVKPALADHPTSVARFTAEAQATAQLQHPGITPVHELGELDDGRLYFTMKEVRGRELSAVIRDVHEASTDSWQASPDGWTFRRLVSAFHQVCSTVAYAHSKGVVHRDLKPDNIMVGTYGEVLVLDWGLAKVGGCAVDDEPGAVVTTRSKGDHVTRSGTVAGTPAYMAPEQARGDVDAVDTRSDVYALGATLYEILSGHPPYEGQDSAAVLRKVLGGPPSSPDRVIGPGTDTLSVEAVAELERVRLGVQVHELADPSHREGPELPVDLLAVCARAMEREPSARFGSAVALADAVLAWLDGSKQRERALGLVAEADRRLEEAGVLRSRGTALEAEGAHMLDGIEPWRPEADKASGWAKQEEGAALQREAHMRELEQRELLRAALNLAPQLPEAHERLARLYRLRHQEAERLRQDDAEQWAALLRQHDRTRSHAAYLRGDGALTLVTDPPGAEVELQRYERRGRRVVATPFRFLGRTPLHEVALPMGSYLCVLRAPGRATVRYPVWLARQTHWDGVRPGASEPYPIALPRPEELGPDDCYVPAGWFLAGDPGDARAAPSTRLWRDAFVMRRFPVTNREYIRFLEDLSSSGHREEALRWAPRERGPTVGELGPMIYGETADGRFVLRADADGDVWDPEVPVLMVDWFCARAYAQWYAAQSGRPWRLPWDFEWEKAARGVDGRRFPWGEGLDASYCCMADSHKGRRVPQVVDSFPIDVSIYGVRGLGGNVRDWCVDNWATDGALPADGIVRPNLDPGPTPADPLKVIRGGGWFSIMEGGASCAGRIDNGPLGRGALMSFRLARCYEPER